MSREKGRSEVPAEADENRIQDQETANPGGDTPEAAGAPEAREGADLSVSEEASAPAQAEPDPPAHDDPEAAGERTDNRDGSPGTAGKADADKPAGPEKSADAARATRVVEMDLPEQELPPEEPERTKQERTKPEKRKPDKPKPKKQNPSDSGSRGKAPKRSRKHRRRNRILRVFIAVMLIAAFFVVANMPTFEITEIGVIGNKVVSDKKIRRLSQIRKGDSIFFVNPLLAGSKIKEDLYIEKVNIDRHLPGTVEIKVKERLAVAQFVTLNRKGKKRYVCIDEEGMVMDVFKKKKKVTMVINLHVLKAEKGEKIKVDDTGVYHRSMELIGAAKAGDVYFKRIFMKGSLVHAYIYDDLKVSGRFRNIIHNLDNGTLKTVVYQLYQNDVTEGTINIGDNNYCSFTP